LTIFPGGWDQAFDFLCWPLKSFELRSLGARGGSPPPAFSRAAGEGHRSVSDPEFQVIESVGPGGIGQYTVINNK
jgi:hypothetical protein